MCSLLYHVGVYPQLDYEYTYLFEELYESLMIKQSSLGSNKHKALFSTLDVRTIFAYWEASQKD